MTPTRHARWAHALFRRYAKRILQKGFQSLRAVGGTPTPDPHLPILLIPNHSSWWDGFFVYELNRLLFRRRLYVMMLESQLRRYSFFSRVGAFGIEPGSRYAVMASLGYAASVLNDSGNLLCMFPQGEMRPNGVRPLGFQRGLELVLSRLGTPVTIIPLAIRAELLGGQRPDVFFRFGEPLVWDWKTFPGIPWLEGQVTILLDEIGSSVAGGEENALLAPGRPGVQQKWDALRGR